MFRACFKFGAFPCCDEFNRITAEEYLNFANPITEFIHNPWFITCNPGYAGRTVIPECIHDHLDKISTILPDYVQILENLLMSEGFTLARSLSTKLYYLFQHCRDTLTKANHYDFGMRVYKSTAVWAGQELRKQSDITPDVELAVIKGAIKSHWEPRFETKDVFWFNLILDELFYGVTPLEEKNPGLENAIKEALSEMGLKESPC